jgi:uncharacterized DUF497 family protein
LIFDWSSEKNRINKIKHGVSFEEAETVFDDKDAILLFDDKHSEEEERFIIIGIDSLFRDLTVCHCYRGKNDEIIRIISARKATQNEIYLYVKGGVEL